MPATIFSGSDVKTLKQILDLNGNAKIKSGADDPTSVAQNLPLGSLYLSTATGKLYRKLDAGSSTNFREIGAGAGGINYIANPDAEANVAGWSAYADAAGTSPVNGTGGSPTTTITRSTSTPLRGLGSFLITKDAANRQGEGVSVDFTIDEADKGQMQTVEFDFSASAAFVVGASSDIRPWIYDVTNSTLIQLSGYTIDIATGKFSGVFAASGSSTSYRLILHVATTNASAWTFKFDNVKVGPQVVNYGPAMTDWASYVPAITANGGGTPSLGTQAVNIAYWRRVGDTMEIQYFYKQTSGGSAGTGDYRWSLPPGYSIDTAKISTVPNQPARIVGKGISDDGSSTVSLSVFLRSDSQTQLSMIVDGTAADVVSSAFQTLASASRNYSFFARVPIAGWSTNLVSSESKVLRMSHILANGTRVTAAPAQLGEYRSQLRDAGALSFTDTNGSPTAAPSATDGIRIYNGNAFSSADSANQPTRYEVFVGKRKSVHFEWYSTTGRTGQFSAAPLVTSGADYGYCTNYDPTTGIVLVTANRFNGGGTTHSSGIGSDGGSTANDPYFEIVVSENPIPVQQGGARSEIVLNGGNGHGSTNTNTRRFTTVSKNVGSAMTLAQSSTLGDSITINERGVYGISYTDSATGAADVSFGISVNGSTGSLAGDGGLDFLAVGANSAAGIFDNCAATVGLEVGDVVRAQTRGNVTATNNHVQIRIVKIAS